VTASAKWPRKSDNQLAVWVQFGISAVFPIDSFLLVAGGDGHELLQT